MATTTTDFAEWRDWRQVRVVISRGGHDISCPYTRKKKKDAALPGKNRRDAKYAKGTALRRKERRCRHTPKGPSQKMAPTEGQMAGQAYARKGPTPRQDRGRQKSAPTWVLHPAALVIAIWSIDRKSAGPYRVNKSAYATTEAQMAG